MKLLKYTQVTNYSSYSDKIVIKELKGSTIYHELKKQYVENDLKCVLSTQVSGWWKFRKRWLLVVDCDSMENKEKALSELRILGIGYKVWESDPGRYWIITNYIGKFKSCIRIMNAIPGHCIDFKNFCKFRRAFLLRAFPKAGYKPCIIPMSQFYEPWISIGSGNSMQGHGSYHVKAKLWYKMFSKWWESPAVGWILNEQRALIEAAKKEQERLEELKEKEKREEELRKIKERVKPKRALRISYE